MFQKVLSLLVIPWLLWPPGMCWCHYFSMAPITPVTQEDRNPLGPDCCCSDCLPPNTPTAPDPASPPDDHAPGCPALKWVDRNPPAESGNAFPLKASLMVCYLDGQVSPPCPLSPPGLILADRS